MIPGGYDAASEYYIKFKYANGVEMIVLNDEVVPNGVKFVGEKGAWIFVSRGKIEASKPGTAVRSPPRRRRPPL